MPGSSIAFAPGRVNLIGEHTDYNGGLSLPFAIAHGITVTATATGGSQFEARALDYGEEDSFGDGTASGWRAFVRGTVRELSAAGFDIPRAQIEIAGDVPQGSGLASSAALEVALALALLALAGAPTPQPVALAALCARVEHNWVGAQTGLLDQLAALCGSAGHAIRIDFAALSLEPVPLRLDGWRLVVVDSGEPRMHSASGYNQRRAECERARAALGVRSLREVRREELAGLRHPLDRRVRHVVDENERVDAAVRALRDGDLPRLAELVDQSHASLRDLYAVSTAAVEATVRQLKSAGAAGARVVGGGFGGHVLALFPPDVKPPADAFVVEPAEGARVRSSGA